jgi:hypothetical protein
MKSNYSYYSLTVSNETSVKFDTYLFDAAMRVPIKPKLLYEDVNPYLLSNQFISNAIVKAMFFKI